MSVKYSFPSNLHLSRECLDLISCIFVANPAQRISIVQVGAGRAQGGARQGAAAVHAGPALCPR